MHQGDPATADERLTRAFLDLKERLMGTAFVLLGHREDAREAVQEAFLKCWRHRRRLDGRAGPEGWIFTVLLNAARDLRRRRKVRRTDPLPAEESMPVSQKMSAPPDVAARKEQVERVRAALVTLPEAEREVFLLRQNGELTYAAIAGLLGAPVGTVKTRMRTALIRLRQVLNSSTGRAS